MQKNHLGIDVPFCSADNNVLHFRKSFLWVFVLHYSSYYIWPFPRYSFNYINVLSLIHVYDLFYNTCFLGFILIHVASTMAFISLLDFGSLLIFTSSSFELLCEREYVVCNNAAPKHVPELWDNWAKFFSHIFSASNPWIYILSFYLHVIYLLYLCLSIYLYVHKAGKKC